MSRKDKQKYTREEKREFKRRNKGISLFSSVIVGMFLVATVYFILNLLKLTGVETLIRYIVIGVLVLFMLYTIKKNFSLKKQPKKWKIFAFILFLIIFGAAEMYVSYFIARGINVVDNLNKNKIKYTSALVTLKENDSVTVKTIRDKKIGIISDTDDTEGYVLAQKIIKEHNISSSNLVKFDDYITMLNSLYSKDIDATFVSGSYVSKYQDIDKFKNIKSETKVLDKYSKLMKKQGSSHIKSSGKSVTEPFTILLLGVDSPEENIEDAVALGDSIMVVTFNPHTLNATLFSIPRDTYVPITCYGNAMSKITHAASGGDSCMIDTVENFIDIDIDYYAKINFRGLINLVDTLGGIDVDVPYSFCETDENRTFEHGVMVKKGWQHLHGREALGLARNRKVYPTCGEEYSEGERNDFIRGQNQQLVMKAILAKAKQIRSVDEFYKVLDVVSKSLDTNLDREQILGFYNVFKKVLLSTDSLTDKNDVISMQRTYLRGGGGIIYDGVAGTGLYEFVPSQDGLKLIKQAMRINLELEKEEYKKSFSFSIDNKYEPEVIGEDEWGGVKSYPSAATGGEDENTPDTTTITCSGNKELGADGKTCVCKWGYTDDGSGSCVKDTSSTCGDDETYDEDTDSCIPNGESGSGSGEGGESSGGSGEGGETGGGSGEGGETGGGSSGESGGEDSNVTP